MKLQTHRRIQLRHLAFCHGLDIGKAPRLATGEQPLGVRAFETEDGHEREWILYRLPIFGKLPVRQIKRYSQMIF